MVFNDLILICLHLCSWPCLAIQIEVLTIWKKINSQGQHIENSSLTTSIRLLILLSIYHLWYACWHQWVYNNCQWIKQFLGVVKACDFFIIYINSSESCITRRKNPSLVPGTSNSGMTRIPLCLPNSMISCTSVCTRVGWKAP